MLRIYRDGANVCRKEIAVHNLIQSKVPVPKILYAEPDPVDEIPSFAILEFVNGLTFQQLNQTGDVEAITQASRSVGETLAAIGRFRFPKPGRFVVEGSSEQLSVGASYIEGPNPIPRLLDIFLESEVCQTRVGAKLLSEYIILRGRGLIRFLTSTHNQVWFIVTLAIEILLCARRMVSGKLPRYLIGNLPCPALLYWMLAISCVTRQLIIHLENRIFQKRSSNTADTCQRVGEKLFALSISLRLLNVSLMMICPLKSSQS